MGNVMEDVNANLDSCAIYERAIQEPDGTEYQSYLLSDFGLQLTNGINGECKDVPKANRGYQRVIKEVKTSAVNNLGHMLQYGAEGVHQASQAT